MALIFEFHCLSRTNYGIIQNSIAIGIQRSLWPDGIPMWIQRTKPLKHYSEHTNSGKSILWYGFVPFLCFPLCINRSKLSIVSKAFKWNLIGSFFFLHQVFDTSNFIDSLYTWSAFNTEGVGAIVGGAIVELSNVVGVEGIHLIGKQWYKHVITLCYFVHRKYWIFQLHAGHSLGAHIRCVYKKKQRNLK